MKVNLFRRPGLCSSVRTGSSLLPAIALAVLPKCPLCLAAYGSALAAAGLNTSAHYEFVQPLVWGIMALSTLILIFGAAKRKDLITIFTYLAGVGILMAGKMLTSSFWIYTGLLLVVAAAVRNNHVCRVSHLSRCR